MHCAILSGFTTIAVTTVLQSFNAYGGQIQNLAHNAAATAPLFRALGDTYGLFRNPTGTATSTAIMYLQTQTVIDRHVGGVFPLSCMAYRSWNLPVVPWLFPLGPFALESPHHPPRFGNPLAILGWLDLIPVEWGIIDSQCTADFRQETALQGAQAVAGWYAARGDSGYTKQRCDANPYTIIPYGSLAMNAISQGLVGTLPVNEVHFTYQQFPWDMSGLTPAGVVDVNPHLPVWLQDLRVFEPCTVMTYCWEDMNIYAPLLNVVHGNYNTIFTLNSSPIGPEFGRGYVLTPKVEAGAPVLHFAVPAGLNRAPGLQTSSIPPPGRPLLPAHIQDEVAPAQNAAGSLPQRPPTN